MKVPGIEQDAIYKATVCARCSDVLLRRYLGTEYLDGGFTKNDKFESKPDGWDTMIQPEHFALIVKNCINRSFKHL